MLFSEDPLKVQEAAKKLQQLASQGDVQCPVTTFDALINILCRSGDLPCAAAAAEALYCLEKQYNIIWQSREVWPVTSASLLHLLSGTNSSSSGGSSTASNTSSCGGGQAGTKPTDTSSAGALQDDQDATMCAIVAAKAIAALAALGTPPEAEAWRTRHGKHIVLALVELAEYAPYGDLGYEAVLASFEGLALLADMGFSALGYFQTQALSDMLDLVHETEPQKAHVALMALACLLSQPTFSVNRKQQLMNPASRLRLTTALKKLQLTSAGNGAVSRAIKRLQQKLQLSGLKPSSPLGRPSTPSAAAPGRAPTSPLSAQAGFAQLGLAQRSEAGVAVWSAIRDDSGNFGIGSTVHGGRHFSSSSSSLSSSYAGAVQYGGSNIAAVVGSKNSAAAAAGQQERGVEGASQDGQKEVVIIAPGGAAAGTSKGMSWSIMACLLKVSALFLPLLLFMGQPLLQLLLMRRYQP
jgi:hypothetical protein